MDGYLLFIAGFCQVNEDFCEFFFFFEKKDFCELIRAYSTAQEWHYAYNIRAGEIYFELVIGLTDKKNNREKGYLHNKPQSLTLVPN